YFCPCSGTRGFLSYSGKRFIEQWDCLFGQGTASKKPGDRRSIGIGHTNEEANIRFPISETTYESIITNLPAEEFSLEDIKALYHMRWGIETSFRELKYAIGLTHFHSKKPDYIRQEIWARLILYNFCEAITTRTVMKN